MRAKAVARVIALARTVTAEVYGNVSSEVPADPPSISSVNYDQGQIEGGGASIVLTGTFFTGATSVTFLGTASSFVVDSPTQITATLPAHAAGSGDIVVTTPDGSDTIAFTYWSPASLTTTGWWRANSNTGYTESGSNGTWLDASGNSRDMTHASQAPPATAVGSHYAPDTNGDASGHKLVPTGTLDTYIDGNRSFGWVVHKADVYEETNTSYGGASFFNDAGGYFSFGIADNGLVDPGGKPFFYQWDTSSKELISTKLIAIGSWYLQVCWYDGTNMNMVVNGVTQTPVAAGSVDASGLSSAVIGLHNFTNGAKGPDGLTLEVVITEHAYDVTEDSKLLKYIKQRSGITLS